MVCLYRGTGVPPVINDADASPDVPVLKRRQGAYLPHWTLSSKGIYAVTFRLVDSLPAPVLARLIREREQLQRRESTGIQELSKEEEERLRHLHSQKIETYLDSGVGSCWLKNDGVASVVAAALTHFDGVRYRLHAWCVMPNHVHVVVEPLSGHELAEILHGWKSFSAKAANRLLKRRGGFWQPEYYDHLIRDEQDYAHAIRYILENPTKAGLVGWRWVGGGQVDGR